MAEQTARRYREQGLDPLEPGSEGVAPRIDIRFDPIDPVRCSSNQSDKRTDAGKPENCEKGQWVSCDEEDDKCGDDHDDGRAKVWLHHDQRRREQNQGEMAQLDLLSASRLPDARCEFPDERHLDEFGRLKAERPEGDPALRPVPDSPDAGNEHECQQDDRSIIEYGPRTWIRRPRALHDQEGNGDRDSHINPLLDDEWRGIRISHRAPIGAGRMHESQPDQGKSHG